MRSTVALLVGVILVMVISVSAGTGQGAGVTANHAMTVLKEGNARYVKGDLTYPRQEANDLTRSVSGQHPIATILSCSDSRVPVEQVFDQGIGDIFVVRVAGNVVGVNEIASVEYGIGHLETPTLVVLGHSQCGAVTAAVTGTDESGSIVPLLEQIEPAVERAAKANPSIHGKELVPTAIVENVWQSIESIFSQSQAVRQRVVEGKLRVVGGVYHLSDGHIEWLGSHPRQSALLVSGNAAGSMDQDNAFYASHAYAVPSVDAAKSVSGETPEEALETLKDGNNRFVEGARSFPHQDWDRMKAVVTDGQHPFATILTCSDSRLPIENLFDAGIGDIFAIRVAGNVAGVMETGSIEYAVEHLHTPLLVVLGHTSCGAVTAAANHSHLEGTLPELVERIEPAVARVAGSNPGRSGDELVAKAVVANIWQSIADLYAQSPVVCAMVKAGKLQVVGATYHLNDGSIDWLGNHPDQATLIAGTLAKCDGKLSQQADVSTDDLPALEQPEALVSEPARKSSDGHARLASSLDKLEQKVSDLQQATSPAVAATSAPQSVGHPTQSAPAANQSADLQQQIQQLQAELASLKAQMRSDRTVDSVLASIVSEVEVLKAENAALRGVTEKTSQQLASLDDDVYPAPANEDYQLERFAGLVDELSAVVEKAKAPAKPSINSPEVKKGSITIFGYLNQQYYERGGDSKQSTFDNKRARLGFSGGLNNYAKIMIQGEFAKSPKLLDGVVTISPNKEWSFKFGQMQPAFGQNFLRSPTAYAVVTPSLAMPLGPDRDIGAQLAWEHPFSKQVNVQLTAGLFNGSGINVSDSNSTKNSVVRAQAKLWSMLTVGVNNYSGKTNNSSNLKNLDTWGNFANWSWKNEEVEFEYIHSKVGGVKKAGWYLWGGHTLKTDWKFVPEIQLVGRYEEYDADRSVADNKVTRTTIGTTFYIDKRYTLIQLNYQFNGEEGTSVGNNEFLANFQVGF